LFIRSSLAARDGVIIAARTVNNINSCIAILYIFMANNDSDGCEVAVVVFIPD
jgi:hypothetical protein